MSTKRRPIYCSKQDVFPPLERDQLQRRLTVALDALAGDELVVVVAVAERLAMGRRKYGPLDLARDGRHLPREALEELLDATAYLAMAVVQGSRDAG